MKSVVEASEAVALAVKLARVKVCPMYPITPSTHIPERIADYIFDGEMDAEMIHVESEHSAASALIGSILSGARSFTATSSNGFALMYEILPILSGMRLPAVMAVANRTLAAPINIWNDHSDAVSARDQGWIQLYAESSQECVDTMIQCYKIAEDKKVSLPAMMCLDGFTLTHVFENVDVPEQAQVDKFLPAFTREDTLDVNNPKTFGPIGFPDSFMGFKKQQQDAMTAALDVIKKANSYYKKQIGRGYGDGLVELTDMGDAEYAILGMGTLCGTAKAKAEELRAKGKKVGVIRLRSFRPFPVKELQAAVKNLKGLAVLDRHISLGSNGPLFTEISAITPELKLFGYIAGLGGKDITLKHIESVFTDLEKGKQSREWLM
ncbi:MAG: pyruvate ferredoxin oxidoreductase [Candidatus Diapherotrites archaeon]|uniref:Pyruvate ferredoxin oxidoreductase n=1 Tax=Candidatus Iainarchaeum sp. TaxID=3101447 RepID=A0A2D6LZW5_9ARCH|nr:pyruvate ferredoxin oxidoreductase [Candidatus Diapherotrites archaeon]